jgi:hypothetical protein
MISGLMCLLFAAAVLLQYNDPDPLVWVLMYGAAFALSAMAMARGTAPFVAVVIVGVIALAWGILLTVRVPGVAAYGHMFDAWEMHSAVTEEARESVGLFIVAGWMGLLALLPAPVKR